MPNLDKTGPAGKGSATGRGLGSCNNKQTDISADCPRRGLGHRPGRGRGMNRSER